MLRSSVNVSSQSTTILHRHLLGKNKTALYMCLLKVKLNREVIIAIIHSYKYISCHCTLFLYFKIVIDMTTYLFVFLKRILMQEQKLTRSLFTFFFFALLYSPVDPASNKLSVCTHNNDSKCLLVMLPCWLMRNPSFIWDTLFERSGFWLVSIVTRTCH